MPMPKILPAAIDLCNQVMATKPLQRDNRALFIAGYYAEMSHTKSPNLVKVYPIVDQQTSGVNSSKLIQNCCLKIISSAIDIAKKAIQK